MNVVDSSAWLEYADDGPKATVFEPAIVDIGRLLVPTITLYDVFKKVLRDHGEESALAIIAQMQQGQIVDLDAELAIEAARLGLTLKIPLADRVILATARVFSATLWTQDEDFDGVPGVRFVAKQRRPTA